MPPKSKGRWGFYPLDDPFDDWQLEALDGLDLLDLVAPLQLFLGGSPDRILLQMASKDSELAKLSNNFSDILKELRMSRANNSRDQSDDWSRKSLIYIIRSFLFLFSFFSGQIIFEN